MTKYIFALILATVLLSSTIPKIKIKKTDGTEWMTDQILVSDSVPTVVAFWATWCHPCIKELEAYNELLPEWKEEYNFNFVTISVDDARTTNRVNAFVQGRGWEFDVYLDPNNDLKRALNVVNVPTLIMFDKNGKQVYQHVSYSPGDEDELEEKIAEYSTK